jgi:hypothetical protein
MGSVKVLPLSLQSGSNLKRQATCPSFISFSNSKLFCVVIFLSSKGGFPPTEIGQLLEGPLRVP